MIVNEPSYSDTTVTICSSELPYVWNEHTLQTSGKVTSVLSNSVGCDSIASLTLIVNSPTYGDTTVTIYSTELPYQWYEMTLSTAGDYARTWGANSVGCDSIVTLHLIVNPIVNREVVNIDETVCMGTVYEGRLTSITIHQYEEWTDSIRVLVSGIPTDSIYNYTVRPYVTTLPVIISTDVVAICGKSVDISNADDIIKAYIYSEEFYAPNPEITWYVLENGEWKLMTNTAIDGNVTDITVKYEVTTDCGVVESEPIVVHVQTPSPENDETLAEVPAYNKYGGRLLTVDLKYLKETYDLDVEENDITWYLVVEGANDIEQGKGYNLNTEDGTPLPAGKYYARINYSSKIESDCDIILQTVILVVKPQSNPLLAPSVVKPYELIRLLNLDSGTVSTINIYTSTGKLLDTFQVSDTYETSFNAAPVAGYYIVEVQTEAGNVSLRYVVK